MKLSVLAVINKVKVLAPLFAILLSLSVGALMCSSIANVNLNTDEFLDDTMLPTSTPTKEPTPTPAPSATQTPAPTETLAPTPTPTPTKSPSPSPTLTPSPRVTTGKAASITSRFACIIGNSYSNMNGVTEVGIQYSLNSDMSGFLKANGAIVPDFSVNLTSLYQNTVYYYRAFVRTADGYYYGDVRSLKTSEVIPTIATGTATSITENSVSIVNSKYTNALEIIGLGIQYANNAMLLNSSKATSGIGTPYSVSINGLTTNTSYYYRAYLVTPRGSYYGEIKSFITAKAISPSATTGNAYIVTSSTALIKDNSYVSTLAASEIGILYSTSSSMVNPVKQSSSISSQFSSTIADLMPETTYYYRAFMRIKDVWYYGDIKSFKTLSVAYPPNVNTGVAIGVTSDAATIFFNTYSWATDVYQAGVEYGLNYDLTGCYSMPTNKASAFFSVNISSLKSNAVYYYRAYIITSSGYYYGRTCSFMTKSPSVTTGSSMNITGNSAIIGSNSFSNVSGAYQSGVEYGTDSAFKNCARVTAAGTYPTYSVNLTDLKSVTRYYYRAYILTSSGKYTGDIRSFTTRFSWFNWFFK